MSTPYFLTLTVPNVPEYQLRSTIELMAKNFNLIRRSVKRYSNWFIIGVRKLECTYNDVRNDYHPHYHMIIDANEAQLQEVVTKWLKYWPQANMKAQDYRPCKDEGSMLELFKYFTKLYKKDSNGKYSASAYHLDKIFQAVYRKRTFQPYGGIRKVKEELDDLESTVETEETIERYWTWFENDWIDSETGECLTGYEPSESIVELRNAIR